MRGCLRWTAGWGVWYLERIPLGTPWRGGAGSSRGHNGKSQIVWRNQPRKIGVTREPRMTARYAHVVDMTKKNPALFISVKVE